MVKKKKSKILHSSPLKLELPVQRVDYGDGSRIIQGTDLDLASYNKKLSIWKGILNRPDFDIANPEYSHWLYDDTIYAYTFLKDDDGNPFTLTAYQDLIGNLHHDFTYDNVNRFILFIAANQIGKSRLLITKALKLSQFEENVNIIMTSKSLPQSQFLLANIKHVLNNSKFANTWREELGDTANTTVMTFKRKFGDREVLNRIICAPAGEGLLGYPVHYLFADELDFYNNAKNFFWKVAYPRTNKTKGQIIAFSNPNPDIGRPNSILWDLSQGDLFRRKFKFSFLDATWNTEKELEIARKNSPSYIFHSTHLGMFPEEAGSFFTYREIDDTLQQDWVNELPRVTRPVYIGVDLGKMNDNTVISIGVVYESEDKDEKYKDLDVLYIEEMPLRTSYIDIANKLKWLIDYYEDNFAGVAVMGYDSTGQKTFGDVLDEMGIDAEPVDFSRKETNKTKLYNDFKLMVENRKIRIVYTHNTVKQMSGLEFKLTPNKQLKKVENKTESIHDDIMDSVAILVNISVDPSRIPVNFEVI